MIWIVVEVEDDKAKEVAAEIKKIEGVDSVDIGADSADWVLDEIGSALWGLEDMNSLDCPLRELRQLAEMVLKKDFRNEPKYLEDTLVSVGNK